MSGDSVCSVEMVREFSRMLVEAGSGELAVAQAAAEGCRRLLMAQRCAIWLAAAEGNELVLRAAVGYEELAPAAVGRLRYPLARPAGEPSGIPPWVFLHQEVVAAETYRELKSHAAYRGEFERQLYGIGPGEDTGGHPRRQVCGVPVSLGDRRLGVLVVENKTVLDEHRERAFSAADQSRLEALAGILALALTAARRLEEAEEGRATAQRATARSLREEAMDFQQAYSVLAAAATRGSPVAAAAETLQVAIVGLGFWLESLEPLLAQSAEWAVLTHGEVAALLRHETILFRRLAGHRLEAHLESTPVAGVSIRTAPLYLVAAAKVLLRHAYCEVARRQQREAAWGRPLVSGRVEVTCLPADYPAAPEGRCLCLAVVDDGDAAGHEGARERLARAWEGVRAGETRVDERHGGLEFIQWVARAHGGDVELRLDEGRTERRLHLPLPAGGEHRKEAEDG